VKARPAKSPNFQMRKPSAKERLDPKKRASMPIMIRGIRKPISPWIIATLVAMWSRYSTKGIGAMAASTSPGPRGRC
jgi:hypothetical protein